MNNLAFVNLYGIEKNICRLMNLMWNKLYKKNEYCGLLISISFKFWVFPLYNLFQANNKLTIQYNYSTYIYNITMASIISLEMGKLWYELLTTKEVWHALVIAQLFLKCICSKQMFCVWHHFDNSCTHCLSKIWHKTEK